MTVSRPHALAKEKGIALITVMLVLAVVAVALMSMSSERQMDTRRTENQLRSLQAWQTVYEIEAWAMHVLKVDGKAKKYDALTEAWHKPLTTKTIALGSIQAQIDDLQGRINLNNLIVDNAPDKESIDQLKRLFVNLDLKPALVDAIVDWIDSNMDVQGAQGAEDDYYSRLSPPYRTANVAIAEVSEVLKIRGITPVVYNTIQPYIYVSSHFEAININTASIEVLRTLAPDIKKKDAESIYKASGKPFNEIEQFLEDEAMIGIAVNKKRLTVASQQFLLSGQIDMGNKALRFQSQLSRDDLGKVSLIKRVRKGV